MKFTVLRRVRLLMTAATACFLYVFSGKVIVKAIHPQKILGLCRRRGIVFAVGAVCIGSVFTGRALVSDAMENDKNAQIQIPVSVKEASAEVSEKISPITGFFTISDGKIVYYDKNGNKITDAFAVIGGQTYRFDRDGYMVTGWYYDESHEKQYYFNQDGTSAEGWILDQEVWYYLEDGQCAKGWKEIASSSEETYWFYFGEDGKMFSSCETPDGYYVSEDGIYVEKDKETVPYNDGGFQWDRIPGEETGPISGLVIAEYPAELYMLCIAGETSGLANSSALIYGDRGCAYGACQLDYRYDLVGFMRFAYERHPDLWPGFKPYLEYQSGNPELKGNPVIGNSFVKAMETDYQTAMADQLEFMANRYWRGFRDRLNEAGFGLDERHVAVSAAMFSVNVNCGPQPDVFIRELSPDMTDEELIRGTYRIRNSILSKQKVGKVLKGTTKRYLKSEPQMALDLLYGYTTIDSTINYGGGVEWHGNPFYSSITTITSGERILYEGETLPEALSVLSTGKRITLQTATWSEAERKDSTAFKPFALIEALSEIDPLALIEAKESTEMGSAQ